MVNEPLQWFAKAPLSWSLFCAGESHYVKLFRKSPERHAERSEPEVGVAKHLACGSRINSCCTRDASSLLDAQNGLHDVLISLQAFLNSFNAWITLASIHRLLKFS